MALHFLHVGKTGGTAIKDVLVYRLGLDQTPFGKFTHSPADTTQLAQIPDDDYFFFCVRDPIARFASAFYSRQAKGRPRYFFEWGAGEREAFERFTTPQMLADALDSSDRAERSAAERAMENIRHVHRMTQRLGSRKLLEERKDRIVYIGRQETLAADFQHLREVLDLPPDVQLPNDPLRAHRGDPKTDRHFTDTQIAALERWYAEDFAIVDFAEELRQQNGWGTPIEGALDGLAPPSTHVPMLEPGPLTKEGLSVFVEHQVPASVIWCELLDQRKAATVAELGVYRGKVAQDVLNTVPSITKYYVMGPDTRRDGRLPVDAVDNDWHIALERTSWETYPAEILYGPMEETIESIPDGSVDTFLFGYGADRSLRGATLALHRVWPKVAEGGWVGGFGFVNDVFEHGLDAEPGMIFPYALHFAELMGVRIFGLPKSQFLIVKDTSTGFDFVDVVGDRGPDQQLLPQVRNLAKATARSALAAAGITGPPAENLARAARPKTAIPALPPHADSGVDDLPANRIGSTKKAAASPAPAPAKSAGPAGAKPVARPAKKAAATPASPTARAKRKLRGAARRLRRAKNALLS